MVTLKWKMLTPREFISTHKEYVITIKDLYKWFITRDGKLLDCIFYHNTPVTLGELPAKVAAERALNKLITITI